MKIETKNLEYTFNGKNYKSFAEYKADAKEKLPIVMVLPEWWGITDYVKNRAQQVAELGYLAVVVDYYGNAGIANDPTKAGELAKPFYGAAQPGQSVFEAALKQAENLPVANLKKVAAIGYCFGGGQALNMARVGEPLKGVVSFHGGLMSGVKPTSNNVPMLVLAGAADTFVPPSEVEAFEKQMDSAKIKYRLISYPGAVHSFTNPGSTAEGKKFKMNIAYNEKADHESWAEMKEFLAKVFAD